MGDGNSVTLVVGFSNLGWMWQKTTLHWILGQYLWVFTAALLSVSW